VLLLDHVRKQRKDRPRRGIGSTQKLQLIDGAAYSIRGQGWNRTQDGYILLKLEKDRQGDVPALNDHPAAVITGKHDGPIIRYAVEVPN
jgi:hypothetical protein